MATHLITITHGDPNTGILTLDKPDLTAFTSDKVEWNVAPTSGVSSIVAILDKSGYVDVWSIRPKKDNTWKGKIKSKKKIPNPYQYKYSIRWKAGNTIPPDHDPIISINPSTSFMKILVPLATAVLALLTLIFLWRKKRSHR